jgi:DNA-binding CsgD family transcriptional regulator
VPTTDLDRAVEHEPLAEPRRLLEVILRDASRRGLADEDLLTLRRWARGVDASEVAESDQVTERTVRNHRNAALRRLRELVGAEAA